MQHNRRNINYIIGAIIAALVVITALVVFVLPKLNQPHQQSNVPNGSTSDQKGMPPQNENANPSGSTNDNNTNPDSNSSAELLMPFGNFISNHHPNLSGSPAPNVESSVCNTTSGASCAITFTMNGITKSLSPETTDKGGAAYWSWTLQQVGLTEGTWKIQAVATLGDQTKTASDAMDLVVGP